MNNETILDDHAFLVSETDARGNIIFANEQFCKIAGYTAQELIGNPHSIVRHEDMPKAAFEDLWKTVKNGDVWQGYVKNKTKAGGFYWVYATIYPYKNEDNEQCYISIRRKPSRQEVDKHIALYRNMR